MWGNSKEVSRQEVEGNFVRDCRIIHASVNIPMGSYRTIAGVSVCVHLGALPTQIGRLYTV